MSDDSTMPGSSAGSVNRIVSLDILRGLALMGMILVHFHQKMETAVEAGLESIVGWIIWMGVEGKSWATFAFLFGAGFAVLMRRLEARGKPVVAIFLRRMAVLGAMGVAIITLTGFTILLDYAIWGVVLLFVRKWSTRSLLVLAVVAAMATTIVNVTRSAVTISRLGPERAAAVAKARQQRASGKWELARSAESTPSYGEAVRRWWAHARWQYGRWEALIPSSNLVLFILGLLAIRHGIFDDPLGKKRVILAAMAIGLASWMAAWWLLPKIPASTTIAGVRIPFRFGLGIVNDQWMALTYIGAVTLLLAYVPAAVRRLSPFAVAGRMALTNYVAQAALISWLAYGYGLSLAVRPYYVVVWTAILFAVLAMLSKLWLSRFAYGPLEWMWRCLTYLEWQPLSRRNLGYSALMVGAVVLLSARTVEAQDRPPLLDDSIVGAIAKELSGGRAHATIVEISKNHRTRGSRPFRRAADYIVAKARDAGLEEARVEEFSADGKIFYGTQRSRPPWDAEFAELSEVRGGREELITSWATQPMSLAQDSESGDVTAELIDVAAGISEADYAGKSVRGKLILTSSQPGSVVPLGVTKHGAVGILSYAQNQRSAWWGEDTDLVRWGHLETFEATRTFGFMISPRKATAFRDRLAAGEKILLHAAVRAGQRPGNTEIATAMIRGADPRRSQEEIVYSCHLDHPSPGANDNASGCATILEVAVTLAKLIRDGTIPRPARTIRFIWPPEIEGTVTILNAKPEWARRVRAVVHMDMVGGGPETKAIFHVSSGPGSLPSFVYDVGQAFAAFVNDQTYRYATTGVARYPLVAEKGGKEPLRAELNEFDMGSDHEVYSDGSWRIPAIYMHDWPDRYIHTTGDTPERIDPTKLKRAAFIGAASGYFLASMWTDDLPEVRRAIEAGALRRTARMHERLNALSADEAEHLKRYNRVYDAGVQTSVAAFAPMGGGLAEPPMNFTPGRFTGDSALRFVRNSRLKGPMGVFGYNYLQDKLGAEKVRSLKLLSYTGQRGGGGDYAYEVLNLVDPRRRVIDIRNEVSAIYGPVPLELVVEFLRALESIEVVRQAR